jgi:glycosyltransferase involved in cell wall biosynthesis
MSDYDLSILIPARNEMFISNTVEDILKNKRGKTEVIVGLDGAWAEPGVADHPDVRIVHVSESRGQRGMTNTLAKLSKAKYIAKCDAHCAYDEGFDVKLMDAMKDHDDWTVVPTMRNLHAFDWKCMQCGKKTYQGPTPTTRNAFDKCADCGNNDINKFKRKILWYPKPSPQSTAYCFDPEPHFQYFNSFKKRPEGRGDITPTMSLQGSFFMLTREKYWGLNICDERFGSWGSQGIEVACKTWLSGGQVMCVQTTWYSHMFRTQGGDFSFPYEQRQSKVVEAKQHAKNLFSKDKHGNFRWDKQKYPVSWLVEKFWPVDHWSDADLKRLKDSEN